LKTRKVSLMTHKDIERQLRHLARRDRVVIAGEAVVRVARSEWRVGDGPAMSLLVATDRLAAAARKLKAGNDLGNGLPGGV
jgi:hypothetical protein